MVLFKNTVSKKQYLSEMSISSSAYTQHQDISIQIRFQHQNILNTLFTVLNTFTMFYTTYV